MRIHQACAVLAALAVTAVPGWGQAPCRQEALAHAEGASDESFGALAACILEYQRAQGATFADVSHTCIQCPQPDPSFPTPTWTPGTNWYPVPSDIVRGLIDAGILDWEIPGELALDPQGVPQHPLFDDFPQDLQWPPLGDRSPLWPGPDDLQPFVGGDGLQPMQ